MLHAGVYYTSITNFIQGYIDNEINLNPDQSCSGTCADSRLTKNFGCYNGTLCGHSNFQRTKCSGDVFDCDVIDSDGTACLVVRIALSTSQYSINSRRTKLFAERRKGEPAIQLPATEQWDARWTRCHVLRSGAIRIGLMVQLADQQMQQLLLFLRRVQRTL